MYDQTKLFEKIQINKKFDCNTLGLANLKNKSAKFWESCAKMQNNLSKEQILHIIINRDFFNIKLWNVSDIDVSFPWNTYPASKIFILNQTVVYHSVNTRPSFGIVVYIAGFVIIFVNMITPTFTCMVDIHCSVSHLSELWFNLSKKVAALYFIVLNLSSLKLR